jgi:rhodanese-related sulfurtransferase
MNDPSLPPEIEVEELDRRRREGEKLAVLDVREDWEREIARLPDTIDIPLASVPKRAAELPHDGTLVVLCRSGKRSMQAAAWLRANGFDNAVNLAGGILAWASRIDPRMRKY